jgi:hypothetical protein
MPATDSKTDDSFFFHGMQIKIADWLPSGVDFAIQPEPGRYEFFGYDKGAPEGDHSVVHRVYPSVRFDKGLLDELSEHDLKIANRLSVEMQAMREACHMEATRQLLYGITTNSEPGATPRFRYEDMMRLMKEMSEAEKNRQIDEIRTLMKVGFTVTVNDATKNPIVVLPEEYREAYDEVTRPRSIWPQEYIDVLRDMDRDKWTKQYMGSFGPFEEQIPIEEDEENN